MNETFRPDELIFRAVRPAEMYWKNGRPTSAAFKTSEPDGLSTDRDGDRPLQECLDDIHSRLVGRVISVMYSQCQEESVVVLHDPINDPDNVNAYHTLLRDQDKVQIASGKAKRLASKAIIHDNE